MGFFEISKIEGKNGNQTITLKQTNHSLILTVNGLVKINVRNFEVPENSLATLRQVNEQIFVGRLYRRYLNTESSGSERGTLSATESKLSEYDQRLVDDVLYLLERIK